MTTIACDLRQLAGDSLVSDEYVGAGAYLSTKVRRIGKSLFGESGENVAGVGLAWEWLEGKRGAGARPEIPEDADFMFLELSPSGIYVWSKHLTRDPVKEATMAIGSGRKVALYCMRVLGMPPARAVEEAARVDHFTRPPVTVLDLHAGRSKR